MYHKCGTKCGTNQGVWGTKNLTTKLKDEHPKKNLCLKIGGRGGQKPKINTEYLKTRVLQGFLGENPKIEIFQVKT